jgi:hypothetical protein
MAIFTRGPEIVEESRIASPDGILDAVLAAELTPATDADGVLIYIVPRGQRLTKQSLWFDDQNIFQAQDVDGLRVLWADARSLQIHADNAVVFRQLEATTAVVKSRRLEARISYDIPNHKTWREKEKVGKSAPSE